MPPMTPGTPYVSDFRDLSAPSRLPSPRSSVLFRRVSDGAVLLAMPEEVYFGLNQVGARIWELLETACSAQDLCSALMTEYPEVSPDVIQRDVQNLVHELTAQGLLVHRSDADTH